VGVFEVLPLRRHEELGEAAAAGRAVDMLRALGLSRKRECHRPSISRRGQAEALAMPLDHGGQLDKYHGVQGLRPNSV
jgi:hypothetical protein